MATGTKMYHAVRSAIKEAQPITEFGINILDAADLQKLDVSDLLSLHFSEARANEVSSALIIHDFRPLAKTMGVVLLINPDAPSLIDN